MQPLLVTLLVLLLLFLASLSPPGAGLRRWMMAKLYARAQRTHEAHLAGRKRELFAELAGTVLEIGPGTGTNFQYMPDAVERWIGIEPNPHMHAQLRAAGARRGIQADFRTVSTEGMQVEDESVDFVLSTLVLCSVPDPAAVVHDIRRILRPGGRFVFVEHVAAARGTPLRRKQAVVKPFCRYLADGCSPDRELGEVIRGAGFASVELEAFELPREAVPAVVCPTIAGSATK